MKNCMIRLKKLISRKYYYIINDAFHYEITIVQKCEN